MPVLQNSRHERFAQELAKGSTATAAYVTAGFNPNPSNAGRLSKNEQIRARVDEILGAAAERAGITRERIQAELGKLAFESDDIRSADKIKALELLGKDIGMFKESMQISGALTLSKDISEITDEELAAIAGSRSARTPDQA